jgi:predicted MFS family arabinose efflux permease
VVALLSITGAVGLGLGYPITTIVAQLFNIQAAFWFGAIAVGGSLVLAAMVLPSQSHVVARRFDVRGAAALSLSVLGLTIVLSEADIWGWTSLRTLIILGTVASVLAYWIVHELRVEDPLVDLRQVRHRMVMMADVAGFLICVAMYLFLPVVVEFVQVPSSSGYGFGRSIAISGIVLVPFAIGTFTSSRFLTVFDRRFGTRKMIPFGSTLFAVTSVFFACEHRSLWEPFAVVGLAGLGMGFTFAAMPGFIVRAVPAQETGSALGFYQVLRNIGLSVGSALEETVLTAYTHHGNTYPRVEGVQAALLISATLCLSTAVLSFVLAGRDQGGRVVPRTEGQVPIGSFGGQSEPPVTGPVVLLEEPLPPLG